LGRLRFARPTHPVGRDPHAIINRWSESPCRPGVEVSGEAGRREANGRGDKGLPAYGRVALTPVPTSVPVVSETLLSRAPKVACISSYRRHIGPSGRSQAGRDLTLPSWPTVSGVASRLGGIHIVGNGATGVKHNGKDPGETDLPPDDGTGPTSPRLEDVINCFSDRAPTHSSREMASSRRIAPAQTSIVFVPLDLRFRSEKAPVVWSL
jgi:hypothetical protein